MIEGNMNVFVEFGITLVIAIGLGLASVLWKPGWVKQYTILRRMAGILFFIIAFVYIFVFGALSILRHMSFHSGGYDLGIFDQVVWNSLRGRLFENSIMIDSPSFLGHHFSPILLALVPLYAVWSDPRALLIVQTIALATAACPLYWWARQRLGTTLALIVSAVYFLSPSLQSVNLFEFHEIALATPLLSFAVYFLLRQRYSPFLICLTLALLVKEEIAFIAVAFGLFIFLVQRQRIMGLGLTVVGMVWAIATIQYVIPYFHGTAYGQYYFVERYLYLGETVPEIVTTAVTQPGLVLQHLLVPSKIEFVLHLLVPLIFSPLIGIEVFALALPSFGYILIGDNAFQNSIRFQYTAPLLPFVFFATTIGLERLMRARFLIRDQSMRYRFWGVTIITAGILNYFFQSAGPLGRHFDPTLYMITAHTRLGYELMRQIPADASLMAESNFVPHLSQRVSVYQASVVPDLRKIDYLLIDKTLSIHREYEMIWQDIVPSPFFETIIEQDGYLLKRRAPYQFAHALVHQFDQRISLLGYTLESNLPAQRGGTISLVLVWRADQDIREHYIIFVHLVDAHETTWTQGDREPANGWFRTDRWNAGDIIPDRYTLELPENIPPGEYQILVGLYNAANGERLRTSDGNDFVTLTLIQVQ